MIVYRARKQEEYLLQCWYSAFLDGLGALYCTSAGGLITQKAIRIKMKKAGYKKGFPDVAILEPRNGYHGMFVEIKIKKSHIYPEQKEWQKALEKKGYYAVIMPKLEFSKAQEYLEEVTIKYLTMKKDQKNTCQRFTLWYT